MITYTIPVKLFRTHCFPVLLKFRQSAEQAREKPQPTVRLKTAILALVPLLVSCASTPLTLAPVGPGPFARPGSQGRMGDLQVYSEPEEYYQEELSYFPHTDYQLFTPDGKLFRRVWNHHTHEDENPAVVSLPPGQYVVHARAQFYGLVNVPVVIQPNRLTKVVLQPGWNPGTNIARSELVQMPQGYCVGWRADILAQR